MAHSDLITLCRVRHRHVLQSHSMFRVHGAEIAITPSRYILVGSKDGECRLVEDWIETRQALARLVTLDFINVPPPLKNPFLHERKEPRRRSRRYRCAHASSFVDSEKTHPFRFKAPALVVRPRCG